MTRRRRTSRSTAARSAAGFTLMEVLAVVVILGVIATAVTLTLAASAQRATFASTLEQAAWMDRTTRRYCLQHSRPAELVLSPTAQTIRRPSEGTAGSALHLSAAKLDRVRILGGADYLDEATIRITAAGRSQTYAMRFTAPPGRTAWLVVLGLTGEVVTMSTDDEVDAFFAAIRGEAP